MEIERRSEVSLTFKPHRKPSTPFIGRVDIFLLSTGRRVGCVGIHPSNASNMVTVGPDRKRLPQLIALRQKVAPQNFVTSKLIEGVRKKPELLSTFSSTSCECSKGIGCLELFMPGFHLFLGDRPRRRRGLRQKPRCCLRFFFSVSESKALIGIRRPMISCVIPFLRLRAFFG